jgi:hypothetical protein
MLVTMSPIEVATAVSTARKACADGTFAALLAENELTGPDAADAIGVHPSSVYRWLNGGRPPRDAAVRLAEFITALAGKTACQDR